MMKRNAQTLLERRGLVRGLLLPLAAALALSGCTTTARNVLEEDRVEELKRDVAKVRFALLTTKTLIARERGAKYLPDLYLRLAELFVEEARYHYQIAFEKQKVKSLGVVSVQARLLKAQAIATYRRLLALWPDFRDADKVYFYMAHEMRESGEYDQMIKTYLELSDKYPRSDNRLEGLLVVGDYYFDKAELEPAERYYQMVLDGPESRVHAMAAYKLAWCKINRADFKSALALFERSVKSAGRWYAQTGGKSRAGSDQIDLRREALVDSVFCYTEVKKPDGAIKYYKEHATSKTTYLAALDKLGNRYYVKGKWVPTAAVYRETLSLTGNNENSVEYAHRLYEAITNGKIYDNAARDVLALINVARRKAFDHSVPEAERKKLLESFEKQARDVSTRLHDIANEKKDEDKFLEAANAYKAYLTFFSENKNAPNVVSNLAEALYSGRRFIEAGKYYLAAAKLQKGKERTDSYFTAVASYFEALGAGEKLSRLEVAQARAGLREAGQKFIALMPKDEKVVQVKFNIARTYYDEGDFDETIRLFTALVLQFPTAKEATVSAHLAMDSYRNIDDFEGLSAAGRAFAAIPNLGDDSFKSEVASIVKGAEGKILESETMRAVDTDDGGGGVDRLVDFASKHKGSEIGEKALLNAFLAARDAGDLDKVFEVGDRLIRSYPSSENLTDVLSTMGKLALNSLQFERSANYLESAAKRKSGDEGAELLKAAGILRAGLGNRLKAETDLSLFLRSKGSLEDKADLVLKVANLHRQANDWGSLQNLLKRAITDGISSAEIQYLLGYSYYRQGLLMEAQSALSQAISSKREGSDDDREAAAAAQFYLAEVLYKAFEGIQLSSDLNQLGALLQQKIAAVTQCRASYKAVVKMGSGIWSVAALGRLAQVDKSASEALRNLAMPEGLQPDAVSQVKAALEANAAPIAKEADEALKQCAATSRKFKVLSEAARSCIAGKIPQADPQTSTVPMVQPRGKPQGAEQYEKILAKNPTDINSIVKLAELFLQSGNPYVARMILAKGQEVKESAAILNLLGVAAGRLGESQQAITYFDQALRKEPTLRFAHANRAALLAQFGYTAEAQAEFGKLGATADLSENDPRLLPGALRHAGGGGR
jgi:cellulose synthase operon protein C